MGPWHPIFAEFRGVIVIFLIPHTQGALMGHKQQVALQQMFDTVAANDDDDRGGGRRKRCVRISTYYTQILDCICQTGSNHNLHLLTGMCRVVCVLPSGPG